MPSIDRARAWYVDADPIHAFDHVLRVLALAERIGQAEGADLEILRAAVLLHDVSSSFPAGGRTGHHRSSAEFAREVLQQESWPQDRIAAVMHCIRAHRFRDRSEPPATLEAQILFEADKLDVLGAIGAARTIGYAALDGQPAYAEPSERFRATGEEEPGEPHSAYHEFLFKLSRVKDLMQTPTAKALAESRHAYLAEFFERLEAEVRGEQ